MVRGDGNDTQPTPPAGAITASLAMILIATGSSLREHLDALLSNEGVTLRHLGALGHLAAAPELSTSDLARRARVTPQSMRATIDHLESIGAVEHRRHGQGKPSELVVTDAGHQLLVRARELVASLDDELLGDVDDPERLRSTLMGVVAELRNLPRPGTGLY